MKVLKNQTLYQCDYCGKRLLSPHGAKLHEENYCIQSPLLANKGYEILTRCSHDWRTVYEPIPGETHLRQPSHDECTKCGAASYLVKKWSGEIKDKNEIPASELIKIFKYKQLHEERW